MPTIIECNRKISELIIIMRKEKKLIQSGQFADFNALHKAKTALTTELEASIAKLGPSKGGHNFPQINNLNRLANENRELLMAAAIGVRSAQDRLKNITQSEANLGAYDRNGIDIVLMDNANRTQKSV